MSTEWRPWFQTVSSAVNSLYQYGTTAQRPTTGLYLGQLYFDTTLGTMVMLTSLSPVTWTPFALVSTFTADAFIYSNSSGALTATAAATNGQLLIGSTGNVPVAATLTGTAHEVLVANGAGTITLSTPQPIDTTSSVTFANITDTALIPNGFVAIGTGGLLGSSGAATNGQVFIGSTGLAPVAATLTAGSGTTITNGAGSITIANSGVTNIAAGSGISVSGGTGSVTISNTGVLSNVAGTGISISPSTGNSTITNTGVTSAVAGTGISVSGATGAVTFTNTGVTSLTGTTNEVIVSGSTGAVTLSTPQAIATTSSPTFAELTLSDSSSSTTATLIVSATSDTNGANIRLTGNGVTTPSKTIRVVNGQFQIANNAYTGTPFVMTDAGNVTITGSLAPSTTGGIIGTTLGDNANAGSVGEVISSAVAQGSAVALTTNNPSNVTSITLTAGDWLVYGQVAFTDAGTTATTYIAGSIGTTTASFVIAQGFLVPGLSGGIAGVMASAVPTLRFNVTTNTTLFLVAQAQFTVSTLSAFGYVTARRVR
jgi:hypothetical protein